MDTVNGDVKLSTQPNNFNHIYLHSLPALDGDLCTTIPDPETPTVSRLRKLGKGLIKHPEQTFPRRHSLSHTFQDIPTITDGKLNPTSSRRNSILRVSEFEDFSSPITCLPTPFNAKKPLSQVRRPMRKPKANKFVDETLETSECPTPTRTVKECDGSAILLKTERHQSQSQVAHSSRGWRRPSVSMNNLNVVKGGLASMTPTSSFRTRRLSVFTNTPVAATLSSSPLSVALGTSQRKVFTFPKSHSSISSEMSHRLDDARSNQPSTPTQRLIRVQSKINMTSEIMDEVKRHSRVSSYVRTDQERYREILEREQSKLILLLGRKFNLERSIEVVLDTFEKEMAHKANTSREHTSEKSSALSSVSRRYSTAKGTTNRHRPSIYLYRAEEIRKLNQLNNDFLSNLVRDDFNVKAINHLIEALESQLREVCERTGVNMPDRVFLTTERGNPIRNATSNLNDIRWQIESMDLGLNTDVDLPNDLSSMCPTDHLLSVDDSQSAKRGSPRPEHTSDHCRNFSETKPYLNLPKHMKISGDLAIGTPATLNHSPPVDGDIDREAESMQFARTPEPSVVGFSLLEDSILHDTAGVGSLKLLGFMFDAIAAAQVADSFRRRGSLFPLAEDTRKTSGSDDSQAKPQALAPCPQPTNSPHEASDVSNFKILPFKGSELVTPHDINVDAQTGVMTTNQHSSSPGVEEWKQSTNLEDTATPLYFNQSSNSDDKIRCNSALSFEEITTAHSESVVVQTATHAATLRPNLIPDLKRLYKEYDYHQLIEERRQIQKALAAGRLGSGDAYIAVLNEKIRRAKMLALENQKEMEDKSESLSKMLNLMVGTGAASSAHCYPTSSREHNHQPSSYGASQFSTPDAQMRNSDNYLENENINQESSPLDAEEAENERMLTSTEVAALDEHSEPQSIVSSKRMSLHSSTKLTPLQDQEEVLLSARTPFGLLFTVTRKLPLDDAPPIGKRLKKKKKASTHNKPKRSFNAKTTENSTSFLCVRVRNENSSSPCEASMQLIAEKLVNLRLISADGISSQHSDEHIKVMLEPGEMKTLACLDLIDKSKRVHFNDALVFSGAVVSGFDKFNSLYPLSPRQNSDSFSIFSADLQDPLSDLKAKLECDKSNQQCLSSEKKMPKTAKARRNSSKSAAPHKQEVSKPSLKSTIDTKESIKPFVTVVPSKEGTTIDPIANSEKLSPRMKRLSDGKVEFEALDGVSADKGIVDDLLQPREVVDWGTSHEDPEKEAIEKNMILLSIMQTQAASEATQGFSTESELHVPNSAADVLQRMLLSEKDPLKDLQAAESIVAGIVQRIAEDVRAEEAEGFSGLEITQDKVPDTFSHEEGMPQHKRQSNDVYTSQVAQAPYGKRGDPHVNDPLIDSSQLPSSLTHSNRLTSSTLPPITATYGREAYEEEIYAEHHGSPDLVAVNDSSSERISNASGRVSLPLLEGETLPALNDTIAFSYDTKTEVNRYAQEKEGLRPLEGSVHSSKHGVTKKFAQKTKNSVWPRPFQKEVAKRDRSSVGQQLYVFNKDLSDDEMQQQLAAALKEIAQNAPDAFVSRSEATGNLTVFMPSNLVSESTQLSKLLVHDQESKRVNGFSSSTRDTEAPGRIHAVAHSSNKSPERMTESNTSLGVSTGATDCSTYVANVLNMAKVSTLTEHRISSETIRGAMDITANDVLTFNDGNQFLESTTTMENLEEETRLLYMQDPVRYNAVVDEFMGLVTSELRQSLERPGTEGNKDTRIDGFLTDTMKDLIRKFMRQKLPGTDTVPAAPPDKSLPPDSLPSFQSTLPQTSRRTSVANRSIVEGQRSCVQIVNLVPDLPLSHREEGRPLSSAHSRMRDGLIKYDDSITGAPDDGLVKLPSVASLPKDEPRTEFLENNIESSTKAHTMGDSANEIKHLLYEQFKAKLILSIFVSYTRRMWALKQKESRNQAVEMITKTISRTAKVAWEFEKHRVLQLKKLIHILDRQTGRQRGWIPYYTDRNVLVMQGANTPCPRYAHYEEQRRLRRAMWLARRGKILPLRLVHQDIARSWNKHLLLGYSKYVIDDKHFEETRNRRVGGRYIPIHFYHMRTPGERARYMRRARFGAAFQSVSKRFSPRIFREKELPLALH
ncbi:unnamed protein product [Phytomonas sp. EM1]|nr:unnamed protein product [Phytomonas sp. EM1]|eukprot:CCW62322.1 unnamed protein product [Phytomonas sp. isolate EM1]